MSSIRPIAAAWISLLALALGCSQTEQTYTSTDHLTMMVANLPDAANNYERWNASFAAGSLPSETDRARYRSLMLHASDAKLEGDTGTVKVLVEDINGAKLGEVEWTLVKEGDAWKIKSAPLP